MEYSIADDYDPDGDISANTGPMTEYLSYLAHVHAGAVGDMGFKLAVHSRAAERPNYRKLGSKLLKSGPPVLFQNLDANAQGKIQPRGRSMPGKGFRLDIPEPGCSEWVPPANMKTAALSIHRDINKCEIIRWNKGA